MESKISIEIAYDLGNLPVIQVLHKTSDDMRDGVVGNFLQHLDHTSISRWLKIEYLYRRSDGATIWRIVPISSSLNELENEAKLMIAMADSLKAQLPSEDPQAIQ